MPCLLADPDLRRAALDPRLLAWTGYRALAWPVLRAKFLIRRWRRNGQRPVRPPSPAMPLDAVATAAALARPGPHVVFDGPGLGEFVMLKRVADELRRRRPDVTVSYAMRDADAVDAVRLLHSDVNVSWLHDEDYRLVLRWLASQRPNVLVLSENYRYPTLLAAATRFGARAFLMNGRRKPRKALDSRILSWHHRWMIGMLSAMGMQSESYALAARALAPDDCDVQTTGDIKMDVRIAPLLPEREAALRAWLESDLPIVAAGSTDSLVEDEMVIAAFGKVREVTPCRLLIAPRRLTKIPALLESVRKAGFTSKTRAGGDPQADVFILDSQGELATAYRDCSAVYVGGSYLRHGGGHNVMEPLAWGLPVAYGMHRGHFEAIQKAVEEVRVGTRIRDDADLAAFWLRFLQNPGERAILGEQARRLVDKNHGAVERTVEMLIRLLPAPSVKNTRSAIETHEKFSNPDAEFAEGR